MPKKTRSARKTSASRKRAAVKKSTKSARSTKSTRSKTPVARRSGRPKLAAVTTAHVCTVRASDGAVTVRLRADHMLVVGGDFKLRQGSQVIDSWKMATGSSGSADHALAVSIPDLDGATLFFQLLVCSPKQQISEGNVDVEYLQDGVTCPCVTPTHWSLTEVPFCNDNKVIPINSRVTFSVVQS